jgi:hypothetical protein
MPIPLTNIKIQRTGLLPLNAPTWLIPSADLGVRIRPNRPEGSRLSAKDTDLDRVKGARGTAPQWILRFKGQRFCILCGSA